MSKKTPAKVTRIELMNEEVSEMAVDTNESEEWLSEGLLTDDDCVKDQDNSTSFSIIENANQNESIDSPTYTQDQMINEAEIAAMDMTHSQDGSVESHEDINAASDNYNFELVKMLGAQDNMINTLEEAIHNASNYLRTQTSRWGREQENTATSAGDQQPSTSNQNQRDFTNGQQVTTSGQQVTTSGQQVTTSGQQVTTTEQQILSNVQIRRSSDETDFDDLADDLSTFLIRKSDGAIIETRKDVSDNDGNDTDELLRVLGDDDQGVVFNKPVNGDKKQVVDESTDEDIFGTTKKSNTELAKKMITRKAALKQRKRSETDQSTDDDRSPIKKFKPTKKAVPSKSTNTTKLPTHNSNTEPALDKSRVKSYNVSKGTRAQTSTPVRLVRSYGPNTSKTPLKPQPATRPTPSPASKNTPQFVERTRVLTRKDDSAKETVRAKDMDKVKTVNKAKEMDRAKNIEKAKTVDRAKNIDKTKTVDKARNIDRSKEMDRAKNIEKAKSVDRAKNIDRSKEMDRAKTINRAKEMDRAKTIDKPNTIDRAKIVNKAKNIDRTKTEKKDVKMVEEFLDDDVYGMASLKNNDVTVKTSRVAEDDYDEFDEPDSDFDDESNMSNYTDCEDLVSSAESDLEDWFTLDLRAERASDYLPLLGSKAFEMLNAEKERVSAKLESLKESTLKLSTNGKKQTMKIHECRNTIADLEIQLAIV